MEPLFYEWRNLIPPDPLDFVIRYEDASPAGISLKELLGTLRDPDAEILGLAVFVLGRRRNCPDAAVGG
jgi:hypothetical protein